MKQIERKKKEKKNTNPHKIEIIHMNYERNVIAHHGEHWNIECEHNLGNGVSDFIFHEMHEWKIIIFHRWKEKKYGNYNESEL